MKIAFTFCNRETKYFRSPDFPLRGVPNSPGEVVAAPSQEKGRRPYSSSVVESAVNGGGDDCESSEGLLPEVDT